MALAADKRQFGVFVFAPFLGLPYLSPGPSADGETKTSAVSEGLPAAFC